MTNPDLFNESREATYCPEDNKLRLYVGRVPREEYEALRKEGWTCTPKQSCDFVAVWTRSRRNTALSYAGIILDEDQGPEDRAADRAERFGDYLDRRLDDATGHADRFEAGPAAHGYQSEARAERAAARHDRIGTRAVDAWGKAEYWQRRTAGVISHALHVSSPSVRMGRIKTIEAEHRKEAEHLAELQRNLARWSLPGLTHEQALQIANHHSHFRMPRKEGDREDFNQSPSAYDALTGSHPTLYAPRSLEEVIAVAVASYPPAIVRSEERLNHHALRLSYENQMLEAQGGRAAFVEMEVGGFIGGRQIHKVNKSPATGRVVSVAVKGPQVTGWTYKAANVLGTDYALYQIDTERLPENAYRAPTDEERAAFLAEKKTTKAAAPKKDACPLVNPTDADAERLQAQWNDEARQRYPQAKLSEILRLSQAKYSLNSGGTYTPCKTVTLDEHGREGGNLSRKAICKVRVCSAGGDSFYSARRVVIIDDKPQKAIPFAVMQAARAALPSVESITPRLPDIVREVGKAWLRDADRQLLKDAEYVGFVSIRSETQFGLTVAGGAAWTRYQEENCDALAA